LIDERLLFERFHEALDVEPAAGAYDRLRASLVATRPSAQPRPWFTLALPQTGNRFVAAALVIILAVAAVAGFFAAYQYTHRSVPVQVHNTASGTCSTAALQMYSSGVGWQGMTRTTDGGGTWRDVSPPALPNLTKAGRGSCVFDADHAWITESTGTPTQPDQLVVLATRDGGQTWQPGEPIPFTGGLTSTALLEFIDSQQGWLLTDTGAARALFATVDGGGHWSQVTTATPSDGTTFGSIAAGCGDGGMTFINLDRGWLTFDCSQASGLTVDQASSPFVAATNDGGRSWTPVRLPSVPQGGADLCGAGAPLFTGVRGVLTVTCNSGRQTSLTAVFRTADAGDSWTEGLPPVAFGQTDFADATTGFVFVQGDRGNDLYRTTDSGRTWLLVKKGLFPGQNLGTYHFIDVNTGFAYTDSSPEAPWKTSDGGKTWSLPAPYKSLPGNLACAISSNPSTGTAPLPTVMTSETAGWALGAQRTTDGGAHWSSAGPPSVPDRAAGYAEFFFDSTHAWVAETAGSASTCADHIAVFSTTDGGQTWQQAAPIPAPMPLQSEIIWASYPISSARTTLLGPSVLYFVDPENGWLLVKTGPNGFAGAGRPQTGPLYRTTDGGLHWTVVAQTLPATGCNNVGQITFSTPTTGWIRLDICAASSPLAFLVTHDGGASWTEQVIADGCGCTATMPVFFDQQHGLFLVSGSALYVTADGGSTWTSRPFTFQGNEGLEAMVFIDPSHGWALLSNFRTTEIDYQVFATSDGGKTWTDLKANVPPLSPIDSSTISLTFADVHFGLLAIASKLFKTTDGGHNWTPINPVQS
jgi:photosystem II stability/assembly factor-like uncharacterized protein